MRNPAPPARAARQVSSSFFAEVNENARAYKVGNHRHVPEMEQEIGNSLGREIAILFVPHLLPISRGILTSIFMRPRTGTTEQDVRNTFEASFAKSRFIRLLKSGELPELKNVRATNFCEIAVHLDKRSGTLLVLTAIDNLGKGAAGQAVQNMNLMLGYDEAAGLLGAAACPLIPSLARWARRARFLSRPVEWDLIQRVRARFRNSASGLSRSAVALVAAPPPVRPGLLAASQAPRPPAPPRGRMAALRQIEQQHFRIVGRGELQLRLAADLRAVALAQREAIEIRLCRARHEHRRCDPTRFLFPPTDPW